MNLICSNVDASITKLLLDELLGVNNFLQNQPQEAQYPWIMIVQWLTLIQQLQNFMDTNPMILSMILHQKRRFSIQDEACQ